MAQEMQFTSSDITSASMEEIIGEVVGGASTSYIKRYRGSANLSDGSTVSFTFEVYKVNSIPTPDITDRNGNYTITVDKA